jgi:hypothetical protein
MTRTPKPNLTKATKSDEHPDAWQRFERAVDAAVKGGPKHRPSKPPGAKHTPKKLAR